MKLRLLPIALILLALPGLLFGTTTAFPAFTMNSSGVCTSSTGMTLISNSTPLTGSYQFTPGTVGSGGQTPVNIGLLLGNGSGLTVDFKGSAIGAYLFTYGAGPNTFNVFVDGVESTPTVAANTSSLISLATGLTDDGTTWHQLIIINVTGLCYIEDRGISVTSSHTPAVQIDNGGTAGLSAYGGIYYNLSSLTGSGATYLNNRVWKGLSGYGNQNNWDWTTEQPGGELEFQSVTPNTGAWLMVASGGSWSVSVDGGTWSQILNSPTSGPWYTAGAQGQLINLASGLTPGAHDYRIRTGGNGNFIGYINGALLVGGSLNTTATYTAPTWHQFFYGDSITEGQGCGSFLNWTSQLTDIIGADHFDIGHPGWAVAAYSATTNYLANSTYYSVLTGQQLQGVNTLPSMIYVMAGQNDIPDTPSTVIGAGPYAGLTEGAALQSAFGTMAHGICSGNPTVTVVFIEPIPNPSTPSQAVRWGYETAALAGIVDKNYITVSTAKLSSIMTYSYYSDAAVHPNILGSQTIAGNVFPQVSRLTPNSATTPPNFTGQIGNGISPLPVNSN